MKQPPIPFTTDGCSGGMSWMWRKLFGCPPPWEGMCVNHDHWYWLGGTFRKKVEADVMLMWGVFLSVWELQIQWYWRVALIPAFALMALLMFVAVSVGGMPFLPLPWRWNYGWHYKGSWWFMEKDHE